MTRLQRATLKAAAFILATLGATGALVAAGLNEDAAQQRTANDTCVAGCR
jgi:hypothetical protein